MKTICIDVGHGGKDNGATATNGEHEKDINLQVALYLKELAEPYKDQVKLIFTREDDRYISLTKRADFANDLNVDRFVSIHHNAFAGRGSGAETIHSIHGGQGKILAEQIMVEFLKGGINKRRVFSWGSIKFPGSDYLTVIKKTNMPAVITEFCFIDNPKDFAFVSDDWQREQQAAQLLDAILTHFNIEKIFPMDEITNALEGACEGCDMLEEKVEQLEYQVEALHVEHAKEVKHLDSIITKVREQYKEMRRFYQEQVAENKKLKG